ncbi:Calcineurin-like phosphoesterase domain ApaH type [Arabidopsis suecica]|uniref:Calcineurin-like phosphoesterase domain ApaH type n=1 Tax=Arabidopsis suecica TaxID=45249 RepID=A0A8T2ALN1_ARASU|nr:Calcineurin-like phosphoesterase domain ApaH type [Arabidopsis suecica]
MEETRRRFALSSVLSVSLIYLCLSTCHVSAYGFGRRQLRFNTDGRFKILQVSDMHYGFGKETQCSDVSPAEFPYCSDLNTTSFLQRTIASEKPDLIVFSGDNVYGLCETRDVAKSMDMAFAPAIESGIPWVAILGNHDQEADMTRETMMKYIMKLPNSLSQVNPPDAWLYQIDGFGNYNLQIEGPFGSPLFFKSILNLYLLDGGAYTKLDGFGYKYDWVRTSQQNWYEHTSKWLEMEHKRWPFPQNSTAPGLVYLHIPMPEFALFNKSTEMTGVRQESTCSPPINSGFFTKLVERGEVKGVFSGHDHVNDFCAELHGINLCYAGGAGYHGYGKVGWARRARVVEAQLEKTKYGRWGAVDTIKTWKRLDDKNHSLIDTQLLWSKNTTLEPNFGFTCSTIPQH